MQQTAKQSHDAIWAAAPIPCGSLIRCELLNVLRLKHLACRVAARSDIETECAVLSFETGSTWKAYADALMRGMAKGLGRPPVMYRPGVPDVSFDEAWLLRTIEMAALERWDSLEFLLRSRVSDAVRRPLANLLVGLSKQLNLI